MKITETDLPGVLVLEPDVWADGRGKFLELWNRDRGVAAGIPETFFQDNLSRSVAGCLRGLHFQYPTQQGKLISVIRGRIFDVAVDIRKDSPMFGRWTAAILDDVEHRQFWIPRGFAHGFLVLSELADVFYKADAPYRRDEEYVVAHDDPALGIDWPSEAKIMNERDRSAPNLSELSALPHCQPDRT